MHHNRIEQFMPVADRLDTEEDASQMWAAIQSQLDKAANQLADVVRHRPLAGIAAGLVIGVALGCLIKRR